MQQNLPIASNAHSAEVGTCSHCLLQYGHIGFRFVRYKCSPWLILVAAPLKAPFVSGVERTQLQIRCLGAIARIDFVSVYELLNDLLW